MLQDVLKLPLDNSRSSPGTSVYIRLPRSLRLLGPSALTQTWPQTPWLFSASAVAPLVFVSSHTIRPLAEILGAVSAPAPGVGLLPQLVVFVQLL